MTFAESIKTCLFKKFFSWNGRASRSEFWYFLLFMVLFFGILAIISPIIGNIIDQQFFDGVFSRTRRQFSSGVFSGIVSLFLLIIVLYKNLEHLPVKGKILLGIAFIVLISLRTSGSLWYVPVCCVISRRLHDTGRSGLIQFAPLPLFFLAFFTTDGEPLTELNFGTFMYLAGTLACLAVLFLCSRKGIPYGAPNPYVVHEEVLASSGEGEQNTENDESANCFSDNSNNDKLLSPQDSNEDITIDNASNNTFLVENLDIDKQPRQQSLPEDKEFDNDKTQSKINNIDIKESTATAGSSTSKKVESFGEVKFCPMCGKPVRVEGAVYCTFCGQRLS